MNPLVPEDVDLRDFAFMPFDVQRLLTSETWVLGTGEERSAAITLWMVSWHQVPAASLPNNDRMLAHLSQAKAWPKVKEHAMRGWILCEDGRWYHPVVAEKALEAWLEKLAQRLSSGAGNAKRWDIEFDATPIETAMAQARALLMDLNPQSRALSKKRTSGIPSGNKKASIGNPDLFPPGIPSGSQETGTGTGTGNIKATPLTPDGAGAPAAADAPASPSPEVRAVLDAYHHALPLCQHVAVLNAKRRKRINAVCKLARQVCRQQGWDYAPAEFWAAYFAECATDPWMRGEVPHPKSSTWKQNIDVLLAEDRFATVMDRAIASMQQDGDA